MAMTIVEARRGVTGGVDTHLDFHVAAALDPVGALLGTKSFGVNPSGYAALLSWLLGFGEVTKVGVEGTGSYGAGLARFLSRRGVDVIEVNRPDRGEQYRFGKSDPLDAIEAARAALGGRGKGDLQGKGRPRGGDPGAPRREAVRSSSPGEGDHPDAPSRQSPPLTRSIGDSRVSPLLPWSTRVHGFAPSRRPKS